MVKGMWEVSWRIVVSWEFGEGFGDGGLTVQILTLPGISSKRSTIRPGWSRAPSSATNFDAQCVFQVGL